MDKEVDTIGKIYELLASLEDREAVERVLVWVVGKFGFDPCPDD